MKKQNKQYDEPKRFVPDPEMVHILSIPIDTWTAAVNRAKEYLTYNELKLKECQDKLERYKRGELYE